jgi:hypothetical protein
MDEEGESSVLRVPAASPLITDEMVQTATGSRLTYLLAVNLLASLAQPCSPSSRARQASRQHGTPWATRPLTEVGVVRVPPNVSAIPAAVTPREARMMLDRIRQVPRHHFLENDPEPVVGPHLGFDPAMDVHLLALTRQHGGRSATSLEASFPRGERGRGGRPHQPRGLPLPAHGVSRPTSTGRRRSRSGVKSCPCTSAAVRVASPNSLMKPAAAP